MRRTFVRVVVSGVGGGQVTSARLLLRVTDDSNSGGRIHHQPGCGWSETGLTWNVMDDGTSNGSVKGGLRRVPSRFALP